MPCWHDCGAAVPEARCPLVRRFLSLARADPAAVAVLGPLGHVIETRATLAAAVLGLADELAPVVDPGDTLVVCLPNGPVFLKGLAAARARGARVALVDASSPPAEIEAAADTVGATAVLSTPERVGTADREWPEAGLAIRIRRDVRPVALPEGTALLKLTSGSTGTPRAFALAPRQLTADAVQILRTMRIRRGDVTLSVVPLSHSYGMGNCLGPFFVVGLPLAFPASLLPAALVETLVEARVAHFPAVPPMVRALASLPDLPRFPDLRLVLTAGTPLPPADGAAFFAATGIAVHVLYGSSECGGICFDRQTVPGHPAGEVGSAMERVQVDVVDPEGRVLPLGQEGRVRVRSLGTVLGSVPPLEEETTLVGRTFLAGDLGVLDERGVLTLRGRVTGLINVAGKKVSPEEVRQALEAVPGVRGAVVVPLPDADRGQMVAAVVAVERAAGLTNDDVLSACRVRLAQYKLPRRLVLVDELPISERGKIRRDVVLELLTARQGSPSS